MYCEVIGKDVNIVKQPVHDGKGNVLKNFYACTGNGPQFGATKTTIACNKKDNIKCLLKQLEISGA